MPIIVVKREPQSLRTKMTLELSDKLTMKFGRLLGWLAIATLLIWMGYDGGRAEMGQAIGRSGDGGIDGMNKEDALGLRRGAAPAPGLAPGAVPLGSQARTTGLP